MIDSAFEDTLGPAHRSARTGHGPPESTLLAPR
jgi:hypothetical protein